MITTAISLPGGSEWLILGLIVLIIFGAKKIPEIARGLGKGINEFKKGLHDVHSEITKKDHEKKDDSKIVKNDNKSYDDTSYKDKA